MAKQYPIFLLAGGFLLLVAFSSFAAEMPAPERGKAVAIPDSGKTQETKVVTLSEGLRTVTTQSRVVKIALQDEAIAKEDTLVARAGLLPSVNASGAYTSLANEPAAFYLGQTIPTSDRSYYSYGINIQQILFDFRGNLSRYEASGMLFEAQKLNTASVRNAVALEFTLSFYDFLEAQRLVEQTEKEVERLEAHLRDADSRYSAGFITQNDLLQARVKLSDARQRLLSSKSLKAVRASGLNKLLLRPLYLEVQAREEERKINDPQSLSLDKAWETALAKRPEIRIVDRTLESVELEATSKKAEFLPKLVASGAYDYTENSYQLHEDNWSLVLGVNINLFEGGKSLADLQKTRYRKTRLIEQRAKLIDEIKLEVQKYLLDLQDAYARILVTRDAVSQAQENLRINRLRYEGGVGTATDVVDAVTLLTVAETNYIRAVYDYRKAEASTHYAMGSDLLDLYRE
jgi:outer membrane protein